MIAPSSINFHRHLILGKDVPFGRALDATSIGDTRANSLAKSPLN
jgi:hypothetical protein